MELICVSCKEKINQHALYHLSIIRRLYNDSCFVQFDIPGSSKWTDLELVLQSSTYKTCERGTRKKNLFRPIT
jgi:hypothetical protein